jgi:hypothetical protein
MFDGTMDEAFIEAVRHNVSHGKPLTRAERESAVKHILASHPQLSDRAIAQLCGVSGTTVAAVRRRASTDVPQVEARIGRDGRLRPIDASKGRQRAEAIFTANPQASLREVARDAGISPSTASDVKTHMRREHVTAEKHSIVASSETVLTMSYDGGVTLETILGDQALQSTESGRQCAKLLSERLISSEDYKEIVDDIPLSRVYVVADVARRCGQAWAEFADALQARAMRRR